MTYYTPKLDKEWKGYKLNIVVCTENNTCLLFCLCLLPHLCKNYEINFIINDAHKLLRKQKESLKIEVGRESYVKKRDCLQPSLGTRTGASLTQPDQTRTRPCSILFPFFVSKVHPTKHVFGLMHPFG